MDMFEKACEATLGLEGAWSDHPADRGGKTKYGITETLFWLARRRQIIEDGPDFRDLTISQAKLIYKAFYWQPLRLDELRDATVAGEIFDTAVNAGTKTAALIAQAALDYLGETLELDGVIGPVTIGLLNKWIAKDRRALLVCLNGFQFIHYCAIVDGALVDRIQARVVTNPSQQVFARGWTKRIQGYRKEG